ncbi:MAG: hypothetical protein JNN18_10525 [Rubrivivax sp.]|nr:hypothetical protein [Rubrivivax sp.]
MSEKLLDESEWKKFAKGGDYKDAALLKALAALAKAGPAERAAALDEVEKQGELLLKAHKGDKKLAEQWKGVAAALGRERKAAEAAAAEADAEGDDDAGPAVLTTKMVPLLRAVPKGETLQAVVAYVGDQTAVMVSRKAIGAPQRKLLAAQLGVSGGVKYLAGQCLFEKNLHTFVLETLVAGMAKKLKAALLAQTEMRWKIRVRGLDPNVVEEDLDDGDGASATEGGATTGDGDPADAARAAYEVRLDELQGALKAALADPKKDGSKLRALLAFAQGKAEGGQFPAAMQGLDALAKQLGLASAAPPAPDATVDPSKAFNARLAALLPAAKEAPTSIAAQVKARIADAGVAARDKDYVAAQALLDEVESALEAVAERTRAALDEWQAARASAIDDIEEVIEAVRETGDPDARAVEVELRSIVSNLTESPDTPQAVAELRRWLESDDVITAAEEVPAHYGSLDLRAPLLVALQALAAVRG